MTISNKISLKKYKTGIIIQARTGSKRFPKKILTKIKNKNILEIMISRLKMFFKNEDIFVATTTKKNDDKIVKITKKLGVKFYRGSENDVIYRFIRCAEKNNLKKIIRLTSDCPLVDPKLIIDLYKKQSSKKYDYSGNCYPYEKRTTPVGSDIEFFKLSFLKNIHKLNLTKYEKEHLTPILKKKKYNTYIFRTKIDNSNLRYTLDYKEDLVVIKKILNYFNKQKILGNTKQIISFLKKNKNLIKINEHHVRNYYHKKINQI